MTFSSANSILKTAESLLSPFSKSLGFYPDISLDTFIEDTGLIPHQLIPVNILGYWTLALGKCSQ
jgi:phosphatidylethanolamine/phosphatidyl-N-methylethanolamine N-methyltransferase